MPEFHVVIEGELSRELESEIAHAIQQSVTAHLSRVKWDIGDPIDPNNGGSIRVVIPRGPIPHGEPWKLVASGVAVGDGQLSAAAGG